jgi:hypothetical protein
MEINAKKGNMMRVSSTVSLNASSPNNVMIRGVARIPSITAAVTRRLRKVKIQQRNSFISRLSFMRRYSLNVGINATDMEPSAKRRRKRFGTMKATEKASDRAEVPSSLALVISRTSPKILDKNVKRDNAEPCLNKDRDVMTITITQ